MIGSSIRSFSLLTLYSGIQPLQGPSLDKLLRNDVSPQILFLHPGQPSTFNELCLQRFSRRTTSASRSNRKSRSSLLSYQRKSLSGQKSILQKPKQRSSQQLSSHTPKVVLILLEETEDTSYSTGTKKKTGSQKTGDIKSPKPLRAAKRFEPPTSGQSSADF